MKFLFLAIRLFSLLKRTRRSSKTSVLSDRNNEFIFDEEHLLELLKRLKQQSGPNSLPMTSEDESNLFEALISKQDFEIRFYSYHSCGFPY
jgi:hypothetical protein